MRVIGAGPNVDLSGVTNGATYVHPGAIKVDYENINTATVTVKYTNIKVKVTVTEGKITSISYEYDFAATLELKILVGKVNGAGSAKTTGEFTNIAY